MLLGLFPELNGLGGIQRASQYMAAVLSRFAAGRQWPCRFLGLNDAAGRHTANVCGTEFEFEGFARGKTRYSLAAASVLPRRPRLVFAAHPHLAPVAWPLQKAGARTAVVAWGIDVWQPLSARRQAALRAADRILPISTFTGDQVVRQQGVGREVLRLLPLALDPSFEDATRNAAALPRPSFLPGGRFLLSVTRLAASEGYKGVDRVIEVLPSVRERAGDIHYVVVGDGDDLERHRRLAAEQGVAECVHFPGRLAAMSDELLACFAHAEVFVLPSKGEGFGLVFLEAMSFSKPVIGGAHGGTLDVIEDGASGFLVDHDDRQRLAGRIIALLTDPGLYGRIARQGRERVQQNFLFSHFQRRMTEILEELCAS